LLVILTYSLKKRKIKFTEKRGGLIQTGEEERLSVNVELELIQQLIVALNV